jgi:ATP-dependent exoDNAse (exonuclease V) beta subunit
MKSDLWKRAQKSPACYVEVPVQILEPGKKGKPSVMRGVIDLVFREKDAWTIVDYKTDGRDAAFLEKKYGKQLENYRKAWMKVTGSKKVVARIHTV